MTETLTKAGVKVTLGIPALKVHSKLCLVARLEDGKERLYSVIATGNFNEKTANIYTDLALFTCHPEICREVSEVFRFIETGYQTPRLEHLLVSPLNNRRQIARMIRLEMFNARREDRPAWIKLKVNNLADNDIIQALYDASAAGRSNRLGCARHV